MANTVKPIPDGYHSVTPYLIINGAAEAIEFYKKAFGAIELFRMPQPDGRIGHAEIKIGDSPIMLADEHRLLRRQVIDAEPGLASGIGIEKLGSRMRRRRADSPALSAVKNSCSLRQYRALCQRR